MKILRMMEFEDECEKKILVEKDGEYYLLKEYYIGGTFHKNWAIFSCYGNDKEFLWSADECELRDVGCSYTSLYECMNELMEMDGE